MLNNFNVKSELKGENLILLINDVVHLFVKNWTHFLVGINTFIDTSKEVKYYSIEIVLKDNKILLEYDNFEKFNFILNKLISHVNE